VNQQSETAAKVHHEESHHSAMLQRDELEFVRMGHPNGRIHQQTVLPLEVRKEK
jgi:hypothetical protein